MKTKRPVADEIRAKILDMMRCRGVSQRQVALGARVSTTTMSRFFRGKRIFTDTASSILSYLRTVPVARRSAAGGEDQ